DQQKMVGTLSGGERGRLHLAKTLLQGGNVLLLDEPSNDLDVETLRALEDALLEFPGNAFVISHDRWFLDRIATHILAFEGDSHVEFFQGNYREYEEDKKRRLGDDAGPMRLRSKALPHPPAAPAPPRGSLARRGPATSGIDPWASSIRCANAGRPPIRWSASAWTPSRRSSRRGLAGTRTRSSTSAATLPTPRRSTPAPSSPRSPTSPPSARKTRLRG